ncbi:MAG: hypothetical protein J1E40_08610 [Oscillospiraceae bacterium]|nr:hypothetical protein [Oscillospiraceae bacterium]
MNEIDMKKLIRRSAWVFLILSVVILFPCMLHTFYYLAASEFIENMIDSITQFVLIFFMLFLLARGFYLSYIFPAVSAVLFIISAVNNKKSGEKPSKKKKMLFIICWVICIIGLFSSESLFWAAMGI